MLRAGGVKDLGDAADGCGASNGLHREGEFDDLVLANAAPQFARGDGLSLFGLALLLLDL